MKRHSTAANRSVTYADHAAGWSYSVPTLNGTGWVRCRPDEFTAEFAAFAGRCGLPVLDIGAGFGPATLAALAAGAVVVAADLSDAHLDMLRSRVPTDDLERLVLCVDRFPADLSFAPATFGAVHAANVFHFLPPRDVTAGFARVFDWLAPGGRLFVETCTPYSTDNTDDLPGFDARKAAGARWPGVVYAPKRHAARGRPPLFHYFDADTLAGAATRAGFAVVSCRMVTPTDLPDRFRLDGRECARLIAEKP